MLLGASTDLGAQSSVPGLSSQPSPFSYNQAGVRDGEHHVLEMESWFPQQDLLLWVNVCWLQIPADGGAVGIWKPLLPCEGSGVSVWGDTGHWSAGWMQLHFGHHVWVALGRRTQLLACMVLK